MTTVDIKEIKINHYIIPFFLLFLNIFLKSIFITNRDIALDEPFSIYYAQMDLGSIVDMLYSENNPPLHFFILHFFIKFFGVGALSVRIPSLIFSSLTAVIIYKIGDKFFNKLIGVGAGLIFTFSTMHIFFSHEARVYSLFSLLTAASLYFYLLIIKDPSYRRNYIWLMILNILLIYSHYFGFFVLFIEVFSLIIIKDRIKLIKPFVLIMLLTALCYTPIIFIFFHRLGEATGKGTWVSPPGISEIYGNLNRFINNKYNTVILLLLVVAGSLMAIYSRTLKQKTTKLLSDINFKIVCIWFVVPYLVMFFVSFKFPMFIDRYILFTSIPFFILIAIVLNNLFQKPKFVIISFIVFVSSQLITIQLNPDNNRRLKEVALIVSKLKNDKTLFFLSPDYAYMGFAYHYNIEYFKQAPKTVVLLNADKIFPVSEQKAAEKILNENHAKTVVYIQAGTEFSDPDNLVLKLISAQYKYHSAVHVFQIYNIHYFTN